MEGEEGEERVLEVCLALLHPPGCEEGHMACAACWAKWAEVRVLRDVLGGFWEAEWCPRILW